MKLAEALNLRADMSKRCQQLRDRAKNNLVIQEGDTPDENARNLINQFLDLLYEREALIRRINQTNANTVLEEGMTLAGALAHRETLRIEAEVYRAMAKDAVQGKSDRFSSTDIRMVGTVDVSELQRMADDASQRHRELDVRIQAANWNTDLWNS